MKYKNNNKKHIFRASHRKNICDPPGQFKKHNLDKNFTTGKVTCIIESFLGSDNLPTNIARILINK